MRLSVFDLDHTLLSGNSSYFFGSFLYREKFFPLWKLLKCLMDYARHKYLGMSTLELHANAFKLLFKGRSLEEIEGLADRFLNNSLDALLYDPLLKRLKTAQKNGEHVLILSSSPDFLVGKIARRLDVAHWKATRYAADRLGKLAAVHVVEGSDKAAYLKDFIGEMKLDKSDIAAYSDSYLDLPILYLAGHPVAVKPDARLKRVCRQLGWEIVR